MSGRRLAQDWRERLGYSLPMLETVVDPQRFQDTIYRAANRRHPTSGTQRRLVFDYLHMTDNSRCRPPSPQVQGARTDLPCPSQRGWIS
ncbi:MAG: hypothetical protein WAT36_08760 [Chromatiaceae bacterium]